MKYAPYSYSRINTWNQCPKKFKFAYIDKVGTYESSLALDRGQFIHLLLEHDGDLKKIKNTKEIKELKRSGILQKEDYQNCYDIFKEFKHSKIGTWIENKTQMFNELPIAMDKHLNVIPFDSSDVIFRGYVDKIVRQDDTLVLIDYKSGKYKPQMPFEQLMYYGISLFSLMPYDKILMMYVFVEQKISESIINQY